MARISKDYQQRLEEFLKTAQQLFFQQGYEKTTVNNIIDTMGVAKGTFYHYFASKKDLLDKLVFQFSQQTLEAVKTILKKSGLNAVDKMHLIFNAIGDLKVKNLDLMKFLMQTMYSDDNLLMRHKIFKQNIKLLAPLYAEIIKQGIDEGVFNPLDHEETAELIFSLGFNLNETIVNLLLQVEKNPQHLEVIETKITIYERTVERILGVKEGSLNIVNRELVQMFAVSEHKRP